MLSLRLLVCSDEFLQTLLDNCLYSHPTECSVLKRYLIIHLKKALGLPLLHSIYSFLLYLRVLVLFLSMTPRSKLRYEQYSFLEMQYSISSSHSF